MQRIQTENNIWPDRAQPKLQVVGLQTLKLTKGLMEQLELKLVLLRQLAIEMQKGAQSV